MSVSRARVSEGDDNRGRNLRIFALHAVVLRLFGIFVVLAGIALASPDGRDIRCIDVFPAQAVPSDFGEPHVVLDIF